MILYQLDHKHRAETLASVLNENALELTPLLNPGRQIPAYVDITLTIWGHGGPDDFAGMDANRLATLIQSWKRVNSSLTTVELITCDARHADDGRDSFTDKLIPLLITNSKVLVTIKCLPRGSSTATTSVLWAVDGSNGYYFVAADDTKALDEGSNVFLTALKNLPPGTPVFEKTVMAANAAIKKNTELAMKGALKYAASGGNFEKLRRLLTPVTAYYEGGFVKAVPKITG